MDYKSYRPIAIQPLQQLPILAFVAIIVVIDPLESVWQPTKKK